MDYSQLELEKDSLEKYGAPRVEQEIAKSPALPGARVVNPNPDGIFPKHLRRKKKKTKDGTGAEITQVLRRGE